MIKRILGLLVTLSFLAGCKVTKTSSYGIPSREYLYSNALPIKGFRTYGYLLCSTFTPPEIVKEMATLYMTKLLEYHESKTISLNQIMVNYWPLKKPDSAYRHPIKANRVVSDYDYQRAFRMLAAIGKPSAKGPVLVAWRKPFEALLPNEIDQCLIVDLSNFRVADLERQLQEWENYLVKDIKDDYDIYFIAHRFSEVCRLIFIKYGDYITDHLTKLN